MQACNYGSILLTRTGETTRWYFPHTLIHLLHEQIELGFIFFTIDNGQLTGKKRSNNCSFISFLGIETRFFCSHQRCTPRAYHRAYRMVVFFCKRNRFLDFVHLLGALSVYIVSILHEYIPYFYLL
jgi:hypothetical protein